MKLILMTFLACYPIDGDTLRCGQERVRLARINAPEIGQPGATEATEALREMMGSGTITCIVRDRRERYGRLLGDCFAEPGLSFSDRLLDAGLVEPYRGRK